ARAAADSASTPDAPSTPDVSAAPDAPSTPDAPEGQGPVAVADGPYLMSEGSTLRVEALGGRLPGLLANDMVGSSPVGTRLASFGGGSVGGAATDHLAGTTAPLDSGTLTVNDDGSFVLAAPAGFEGQLIFYYRLENGSGWSEASVTVTV